MNNVTRSDKLKPVNIENLEWLLTKIWEGELFHSQRNYYIYIDGPDTEISDIKEAFEDIDTEGCHCNTAACLAGWDLYFMYKNGELECDFDGKIYLLNGKPFSAQVWKIAQEHNSLNIDEAMFMFHSRSTKLIHELCLKAFKSGRRFINENNDFIKIGYGPTISNDFQEQYYIPTTSAIFCSRDIFDKVVEFFDYDFDVEFGGNNIAILDFKEENYEQSYSLSGIRS